MLHNIFQTSAIGITQNPTSFDIIGLTQVTCP